MAVMVPVRSPVSREFQRHHANTHRPRSPREQLAIFGEERRKSAPRSSASVVGVVERLAIGGGPTDGLLPTDSEGARTWHRSVVVCSSGIPVWPWPAPG